MRRILSFMALSVFFISTIHGAQHRYEHEHVLGTSLTLTIDCDSKDIAQQVETASLAEIDRLDAILSSYRGDSELARWLQNPARATQLSDDLVAVLRAAESFRIESRGAFDVRVWDQASRDAHDVNTTPYKLDLNQVTRNDAAGIQLDGLAKGYILDRVSDLVRSQFPTVEGFVINIGGDLRQWGGRPMRLSIDNPHRPAEGAAPLTQFVISDDMAMATSGTYRRGFHIRDPRSGLPARGVLSASVIAADATTADAMATALCVMNTDEALEWIDTKIGCEALVVTSDGQQICSRGWPGRNTPVTLTSKDSSEQVGLHVWFKLDRPDGNRYRRPYVAVWLEDADGFPVKTEVLWMQKDQPGPRWHRDLTRWYRNDRMRQIVESTDLIETVSGATRGPGEYEAHFDGSDNAGQRLSDGIYTLCLEAARENGTYKIIRERFRWGDDAIKKKDLAGNVEIAEAAFEFIPTAE